ncbi:MAG: aldehyde dehydrogenase family protein, partial [Verrucomicrobia bacterium]|nr:aldehyde dehydrogenase family protein [Verrucomicrobiota bacterium]
MSQDLPLSEIPVLPSSPGSKHASPDVREIFHSLDYGPAPELTELAMNWLAEHKRTFHPFINGEFRRFADMSYFESYDPQSGRPLAKIAHCAKSEVDAAVSAAEKAFFPWTALSGYQRARYLYGIDRQIQKHSRLFAVLETLDNGKPIRESRDIDVPLAVRHFYHHAGWAQIRDEKFIGYEPIGVCGQIIHWNFPFLLLARKIAPAIAAGNTVVLKPAELTSLSALLFADLLRQIQLPPGVVNIVTGDGQTGGLIVNHPGIKKVAFTGSTEVGKIIRRQTAGSGKKLSLELGGKSPFLIFDDADLDGAVEGVVDAIWCNQWQACCAGSRLLVQESIVERISTKLKARMETLRMGDPLDKAIDLGTIVSPVQLRKIQALVEKAKAEGLTCWQPSWSSSQQGLYFPPTLFTGVEPASALAQAEISGPVLVVMTFRTPAEAVELANNTQYGLAASIWTENVSLALDIAQKIKSGVAWVNCSNLFDAASGFGGYRESGYGREGGDEGMYEYLIPNWDQTRPVRNLEEIEIRTGPAGLSSKSATIDRSVKLFIGGKQTRPDSGYSFAVTTSRGELEGEAGLGTRKDIRDAVEAANKAASWSQSTSHLRAQILYYLAENLEVRAEEFEKRLVKLTGNAASAREVRGAIERLFYYAAWADKYDGLVHQTPFRTVNLAIHEPWGTIGLICPAEFPLLAFISLTAPAIAMGNRVVVVPSWRYPL